MTQNKDLVVDISDADLQKKLDEIKGMYGRWHNFHGYDLDTLHTEWKLFIFPVQHYSFRLHEAAPLTYEHPEGFFVQPNKNEDDTDLGSIPPPLRGFFPATEIPRTYNAHDSGYLHEGLWVSQSLTGPYVFRKMSREEIDQWMQLMGVVESVQMSVSYARAVRRLSIIHTSVRIGGIVPWRRYASRRKEK